MLIALALIALPWLSPFNPGPTTSVVPLLVSWTCAAALLLTRAPLGGATGTLKPLGAFAAFLFGAALWRAGFAPGAEVLALGLSLLAILACAVRFSGSSPADARLLARAWLLAGLASAFIGWLQYTGMGGSLAPWVSHANLGEAFGNLRQRHGDHGAACRALPEGKQQTQADAKRHLERPVPQGILQQTVQRQHGQHGPGQLPQGIGLAPGAGAPPATATTRWRRCARPGSSATRFASPS